MNTETEARPAYVPGAFYRVVFNRPIGLGPGVTVRAGVQHEPVSGETLNQLTDFVERAEAI